MKKEFQILISLVVLTLVVTSSMARNNFLISCEELSQIDTGGGALDITVVDNYAFICDSLDNDPGGLVIINVSDPTNPIRISSILDDRLPVEVTVHDNIAYVADFTYGLEIINVSIASNPIKIGSYQTDDMYTTSVKVLGDFAYVGDIHHGLFKLDITNLSDPVVVDSIPSYSCPSIALSTNFLITINHQEYFSGLEIRDPIDLQRIGGYFPLDTDFINPVIQGNLIFAVNHHQNTGEVQIIDISDPSYPVFLSDYKGGSVAQQCFVDGDLLYVACSDAGIDIVDISKPAEPRKIGSYSDNSGVALDIYVKDNIAYVADESDGLEVIQMTYNENSSSITESSSNQNTSSSGLKSSSFINGLSTLMILGVIVVFLRKVEYN